ncbi:MAG: N-acetyl sugar amidotransferase, partial [Patescibacteria group bacterium]
MKYCKRCLYPANHPLGITFDSEGICSGCRVHEEKDELNWKERGEKLKKILNEFRNKDGKNYDCIIPVSGARDSYFIVDTIKNKYKMHPLLVTYNKQYNTKIGIRNLSYLKALLGCDLLTLTVSPKIVRKVTRATIEKLSSIYWHCLAGQTVFPVQTAVRFKIPLIVWGAHQGNDQVGMYSHLDEVEMTRKYRKDHDIMGVEAEDLVGVNGIEDSEIAPYKYPHDKEIEKVGVRGIYLNNYIRWDSKAQHEDMIKKYKYETTHQHRTFDTYNDVDCFNYS